MHGICLTTYCYIVLNSQSASRDLHKMLFTWHSMTCVKYFPLCFYSPRRRSDQEKTDDEHNPTDWCRGGCPGPPGGRRGGSKFFVWVGLSQSVPSDGIKKGSVFCLLLQFRVINKCTRCIEALCFIGLQLI